MTDPIIEAAAQALQNGTHAVYSEHNALEFARIMLTAVTPLIEANALERAALANGDVLQNDLRDLLNVLGMPSGAQPRSPHEVFQDALVEVKRLVKHAKTSYYR